MTSATVPKKSSTFGQAYAELEAITNELEAEDLDLDEAIVKFERGLQLAEQLKTKLRSVEQRVDKIRQKFDQLSAPADDQS